MLSKLMNGRMGWPADAAARILARLRIPPAVLTAFAVVLSAWAGVLFAFGRFAVGAALIVAAGAFDLLHGRVGRIEDRRSLFGIFFDSILHRYADLVLFLGLLVYYAQVNRFVYVVVVSAALAGAVMVSYAKSRAASLVRLRDFAFWERPERLALLVAGGLASLAYDRAMDFALWILALGPNVTVVGQILRTRIELRAAPPPRAAERREKTARPATARPAQEVGSARAFTRSAGR